MFLLERALVYAEQDVYEACRGSVVRATAKKKLERASFLPDTYLMCMSKYRLVVFALVAATAGLWPFRHSQCGSSRSVRQRWT